MSATDFLKDSLRDALDRAFAAEQRLIKFEGAHRSLLAHLRMAADDCAKTKPIMSARYHEVANDWEKWCEEPQESLGEVAGVEGPVSGHPGPAASSQAQTPVGTAQTVTWEGVTVSLMKRQAQ